MSSERILGLHHVTGAASSAQRDHDFYTGVLGLRLVKRTINHETADHWHLFYGDREGRPGTVMTNFLFDGLPVPPARPGRGSIAAVSFSVPSPALDRWRQRLVAAGHQVEERADRFGEPVLSFRDPSGIPGELIGCGDDRGAASELSPSVRGFHSVTLVSRLPELTLEFFTGLLGARVVAREQERTRLAFAEGGPGRQIDLLEINDGPWACFGLGALHHVAFTAPDVEAMERLWRRLSGAGLIVTDLRDRKWFHSMYLTEPGGINVEISNREPGFTVDESLEELGTTLQLPAQWADRRAEIEARLPPLDFSSGAPTDR